jgi:arsenate reductase
MSLTIYHNPRCSKSRQTLALIEDAGHTPQIILYLNEPPNIAALKGLMRKLQISDPRDMMRTGERLYKELNLKQESSAQNLLAAIAENPILLERPIVVCGEKAVIGRPPEAVKAFL